MSRPIFAMLACLTAMWIGCAGPRYALTSHHEDQQVVYAHGGGSPKVVVGVAPDFAYRGETSRTRNGVEVKGHVFSGKPGEIFVARLFVSDFEKITGLDVPAVGEPFREFPPATFYDEIYCSLTRARAVVVGEEIVVAAMKSSLLAQAISCEDIDSLQILSKRFPETVLAFEETGDRSIQIHVKR